MKERIKVYIVNKIDNICLGIGIMSGRPFYPTNKMMYVGFNDNAFVFLREGQNRKKLTKKIIFELVGYSSSSYLLAINGDILNSYEVT